MEISKSSFIILLPTDIFYNIFLNLELKDGNNLELKDGYNL